MRSDRSLKEKVIAYTKDTGVLPCIKLHEKEDFLAYAQAMYDGGTRVLEVTMRRNARGAAADLPRTKIVAQIACIYNRSPPVSEGAEKLKFIRSPSMRYDPGL